MLYPLFLPHFLCVHFFLITLRVNDGTALLHRFMSYKMSRIGYSQKLVRFFVSSDSRRIINLSPVMVIPEEQPAQPALPIQPEGMRVVCGHCGNTFLVRTPATLTNLTNHRGAHAELCCCAVVGRCILIILRAQPQPVLSYLVMGSKE